MKATIKENQNTHYMEADKVKKKQVLMRWTEAEHNRAKAAARKRYVSMSQYIRMAVDEKLDRDNDE